MKSILIIGAGFLQSFLIKKARQIGYYVIAVDKNPDSVGFKHANEFEIIDIVDPEACLKFAIKKKVNGVITAATDYGVITSAFIASRMGLPGLSYKVAQTVKNKSLVRKVFVENGVDDITQHYEIFDEGQLNKIIDRIKLPVIIKPSDGSGSKAVRKVKNLNEIKSAWRDAFAASLSGSVLIEDFVAGKEYGVESIVINGEPYVLGIMEKHMTKPPLYAELGHSIPSLLHDEGNIVKSVNKAIRTLQIDFGAVNMDVIATKDGQVSIVDVGARMGGNLIGSHIIPAATGFDYMKCLINMAVAEDCELPKHFGKLPVATKILALKPGKVQQLPSFSEIEQQFNVTVLHNLHKGQIIRRYSNNLDGCGYVLAVGSYKEDCLIRAEEAKNAIDEGIVRV